MADIIILLVNPDVFHMSYTETLTVIITTNYTVKSFLPKFGLYEEKKPLTYSSDNSN
jgi:hypothetical protein